METGLLPSSARCSVVGKSLVVRLKTGNLGDSFRGKSTKNKDKSRIKGQIASFALKTTTPLQRAKPYKVFFSPWHKHNKKKGK